MNVTIPKAGIVDARLVDMQKTHVLQRPTKRLVEMKVLVLGLCRTGTNSIQQALFDLGYLDVYHMTSLHGHMNGEAEAWAAALHRKNSGKQAFTQEQWDQLTGYCEALTDVPPSLFPEELIAAYPNAKVIVTTRDSPAAWHKSVLDTVYYHRTTAKWAQDSLVASILRQVLPLPPMAHLLAAMYSVIFGPGTSFEAPENGEAFYTRHNEAVRRAKGPENVLMFNVKEGWGPLCEFLGKDVPDAPFPRVNDTTEFRARLQGFEKKRSPVAMAVSVLLNAAKVAGVVGVAVLAWRRFVQ